MRKRDEDHLIGIWRHKIGGWEIKYKKDGKEHSEYRKDRKEAELRGQYWKAALESPPDVSDLSEEHPVHYWEKTLRRVTELALKHPKDKSIAATCRSIAAAATAALRSCKYIPAPGCEASPDGAPLASEIQNLSTEDLERLAGKK